MIDKSSKLDFIFILVVLCLSEVTTEIKKAKNRQSNPGTVVRAASLSREFFAGWSSPEALLGEGVWRWSVTTSPMLQFPFESGGPAEVYLLALHAGANGRQMFELELNGHELGGAVFESAEPKTASFLVDRSQFMKSGLNRLRFSIPDARVAQPDARLLGLKLYSLSVAPVLVPTHGIGSDDSAYFFEGFSVDEGPWRWTNGPEARILYPLQRPNRQVPWGIQLTAATVGHRQVEVLVNGTSIAFLEFDGWDFVTAWAVFRGDLLLSGFNEIELRFDDTFQAEGDPREQLGLAVRTILISPEAANPPAPSAFSRAP